MVTPQESLPLAPLLVDRASANHYEHYYRSTSLGISNNPSPVRAVCEMRTGIKSISPQALYCISRTKTRYVYIYMEVHAHTVGKLSSSIF